MRRRIVRKRPYTPDQTTRTSLQQNVDSDADEIIDVETIQAAHFVDVRTTSLCEGRGQTAVAKSPPRVRRITSRQSKPLPRTRSIPRITLVGRGRPENLTPAFVTGIQINGGGDLDATSVIGQPAPLKRVPILADEGIGTFAVSKLPLEEMTMSTKALRAIQEDHSLSKIVSVSDEDSESHLIVGEEKFPTKPSTSSDVQKRTFRNQSSRDTLACAHPHCQLTFPNVDDLILHLVSFHCQHQFRQRKLTFISLQKYEAWKRAHEKMFAATMVEEPDREECEGIIRIRYHCEYCNGWRQQLEKHESNKEGKCMQVLVGCPAHFAVSFSRQQSSVIVFGCFAHLGHRKRVSPTVLRTPDSTIQPNRWKVSPAQCKYCLKWFGSHVMMNRHVKDLHMDTNFSKGTTIECGDPHCNVVCDRMSTLCQHVAQEHRRDDLVIEEFRFSSLLKFRHWKDQVETDTISKFVLSSSRTRASGIIQSYYLCHLSGYANRSRHSSLSTGRLRSTKKLGRYCTAFINTKELLDGAVTVQCCLGHFGHSFDVRRLPLPNKVKEEVSELLLKGADPQNVQDTVRKNYSPGERGYYLKRYEIRNIADKLRRRGLILPKEKEEAATALSLLHANHSQTKPAQVIADNISSNFVRFQSVRLFPEERGRLSRFSYAKVKEFTNAKVAASPARGIQHSQNPSNHSTAPHTVLEGLRDVSPPIIGTSGYTEYGEEGAYNNLGMVIADEGDEGHEVTYFIDAAKNSESMLKNHPERDERVGEARLSRIMPLLMEPQPTGNVGFDETMSTLKRKINALGEQIKRTVDAEKRDVLMEQVRNLQGQLVRGVPQTTAFIHMAGHEFDGEEHEDDFTYEPVDRDDTVCLEVEVESSEAPYGVVQIPEGHYDDISSDAFDGEPYEEVVSAGYEQSSELSYN